MREVYLDHAATTPLRSEVVEAMLPYLREHWGNPLSLHRFGERPREAMEKARAQVAEPIGAQPTEIYFTASGSEANNMAIKGAALMNQKQGKHIVVSAIEHHSVLNSAKTLEKLGFEVTVVPVDEHGLVNPNDVAAAIREDTTLVSVMHANNEIGTIEPIAEIAKAVKERGTRQLPYIHTDAVASAGVLPVNVKEWGGICSAWPAISFTAHRGPGPYLSAKGCGSCPS
jgi:cysteine desulfurase